MNKYAINHLPKSKQAYAFDGKTLHIKLKTAKNDVDDVSLIWGDPFAWEAKDYAVGMKKLDGKYNGYISEMEIEYSDGEYDYWFIEVKPDWYRTRYAFLINRGHENVVYHANGAFDLRENPDEKYKLERYFNFPYINKEDIFSYPDWVKDTIWYQIFPERFANGDSSLNHEKNLDWGSVKDVDSSMHFGGDIQGMIDKLDYIKDLGITGIYFTPLFEAISTHKYDTIDYFKIDPDFGTNLLFKKLVQEAHSRGIKVMLDAVFNHCGYSHPYFQDVVEKGKESKFYNWFHILKEPVVNFKMKNGLPENDYQKIGYLNFETFAYTPYMPKWRTGNSECERYLLDVAKYWIEEYDIDGWRLDVSDEVSHDFWRKFKIEVRAVKEDLYILGENWVDSTPWLRGDQFDAVMNYEFTFPVRNLLENKSKKGSVKQFRDSISRVWTSYQKNIHPALFNLLDSHDTSRIHSVCSEDIAKTKLAYILLLTFSGTPSIFYGGEHAVPGSDDLKCRQCMPWSSESQNSEMFKFVQKLISIRHEEPLTKVVDIKFVTEGGFDKVIAYTKELDGEILLVIMNPTDKDYKISVPKNMQGKYSDLIEGNECDLSSNLSCKANEYALLKMVK